MAKPRLLSRVPTSEAANAVIEAFISAFERDGSTWQTKYKDGLNAYKANEEAKNIAKQKLTAWYNELVVRSPEIARIFGEAKLNYQKALKAIVKPPVAEARE